MYGYTNQGGLRKLKCLVRYLVDVPELVIRFGAEDRDARWIDVYVDSDWAGCMKTRKSTSGGMMVVRGGLVKSWASTQGSTSLSSGEAEYYAVVKGACEGIGLKQLLQDMGVTMEVRVWVDSSAAKSMTERTGLGKVRHMDVRFLWIQEVRRRGGIKVAKINGEENPADIMTKPKSVEEIRRLISVVGAELVERT